MFRGILQGSLTEEYGSVPALVIASGVFGVAHILNGATSFSPRGWNWKLVGAATLAGLLFGTVYEVSGSLTVPTFLHALLLTVLQLNGGVVKKTTPQI
jgi:membrane protease YdiL (CAAX protease family)